MSRQHVLAVEPIKADPTSGRWHVSGSRVYAGDLQIADCELPGSNLGHHGDLSAVEQTRAEAKANAKLMAQAKAMAELLGKMAAFIGGQMGLFQGSSSEFDGAGEPRELITRAVAILNAAGKGKREGS